VSDPENFKSEKVYVKTSEEIERENQPPRGPEQYLEELPPRFKDHPEYYDDKLEGINIGSDMDDDDYAKLSNFAETPFVMDGVKYASMEGFIQSLKTNDPEKAIKIQKMSGAEAKFSGKKFAKRIARSYQEDGISVGDPEFTEGSFSHYQGIEILYRSEEHFNLIERAIRAKFEQNPDILKSLIGPENNPDRRQITHKLTNTDGSIRIESAITSLPAEAFTTILMRIRQEEQQKRADQTISNNLTQNI